MGDDYDEFTILINIMQSICFTNLFVNNKEISFTNKLNE